MNIQLSAPAHLMAELFRRWHPESFMLSDDLHRFENELRQWYCEQALNIKRKEL